MPQDRRMVTVVFADIVGSTSTSAGHDPEVVRAERVRLFNELSGVLTRHGGTIEKFIGDAVMAVFGAPELHEDDAERAVRAALEMRDAVVRLRPQLRLPVQLRIGINTGEVVAEEPGPSSASIGLVTGEPIVAGARLEQGAHADEILVGDVTRRLTDRAIRYGSFREVSAKGIGSISAWPAEGLLVLDPPHAPRTATSSFVDRDVELRTLRDLYSRLGPARRAQLVTILGEAGAGKSRLALEFLSAVPATRKLVGRCPPYGAGTSFWPVRDILQADSGIVPTDQPSTTAAKVRSAVRKACGATAVDLDAITNILEGIVSASTPQVPTQFASELTWALRRYLEGRAAGHPLVVVIDDLQWAEPALVETLDELNTKLLAPVLLIGLARPELLETHPHWAGGKRNAATLELTPLPPADVDTMVTELAGARGIGRTMRLELDRRAGGNPLYVEEFMRTVVETGGVALPPTLHGLIAARLDRLPRELRHLLQLASTVGEVFSIDDIEGLGIPRTECDRLIDACLSRELIIAERQQGLLGGPSFRFNHILVRDVAHGSLPKLERAELHDRYSRWVAEASGARRDEYAGIIAHHAEQAYRSARDLGAEDSQTLGTRAFEALITAAERAGRNADRRIALDLYERANSVGTEVNAAISTMAEVIGQVALLRLDVEGGLWTTELDHALATARAAGPSRTLLDLLERAGEAQFEDDRATRALGEEAVSVARALGDPDLITQAMLVGSRARAVTTLEFAAALLDTLAAVEFGRANGARAGLASALRRFAFLLLSLGRFEEGVAATQEYERLVSEHTTLSARLALVVVRRNLAFAVGNFADAVAFGEAQLAIAEELGVRSTIRSACSHLGDFLYHIGDLERSRTKLIRALENTNVHERSWHPEVSWRLARTELEVNDVASAEKHAEHAVQLATPNDIGASAFARAVLGRVYACEDQGPRAREMFEAALEMTRGRGDFDPRVRIECGRGLIRLGDVERARDLLVAARAFYGDPVAQGWRDYIDARLRTLDVRTSTL